MTDRSASSVAKTARYTEMTPWRRLQRSTAANVSVLFLVLLAGIAVASSLTGEGLNFYTQGNLAVLSQQIPVIAILAIGAGILMIGGEFDLSVTSQSTTGFHSVSSAMPISHTCCATSRPDK